MNKLLSLDILSDLILRSIFRKSITWPIRFHNCIDIIIGKHPTVTLLRYCIVSSMWAMNSEHQRVMIQVPLTFSSGPELCVCVCLWGGGVLTGKIKYFCFCPNSRYISEQYIQHMVF